MGKYNIPNDAWRVTTYVLMRYPESKAEIMDIIATATGKNHTKGSGGSRPSHADPTQTAAIKLATDVRYQRLKREVAAVELASSAFDDMELKVISERFWKHRKGVRVPRLYAAIDLPYSERQMHKIVQRMIYLTATYLGEVCLS